MRNKTQFNLKEALNNDITQWINSINNQKLSQNTSSNAATLQASPSFATVQNNTSGSSQFPANTQPSGSAFSSTDSNDLPDPPESEETFVLGIIDGVIQWIPTEDCGTEE